MQLRSFLSVFFVIFALLFSLPLNGLQPERKDKPLKEKEFFKPELAITSSNVELQGIRFQLSNRQEWDSFFSRYGSDFQVYIEPRTGRPTNILGHIPIIPGNGLDNRIQLQDLSQKLGKAIRIVDAGVVADLTGQFIQENHKTLNIDVRQMGKVSATQVSEELWHVNIPQLVNGIPVRDGRLAATISHGNLIILATEIWADVQTDTTPRVLKERAIEKAFAHAGGRQANDRIWKDATLEMIPYAPAEHQSGESFAGPVGQGLRHYLVWTFGFQRDREDAKWEAMIDAHTGELIAFKDVNQYFKQKISGSVYPLTSTEVCPSPEFCGIMQLVFPMPWANTGLAAPNNFTNSAGVFEYTSGLVTTTLNGKYIRVSDSCGALSKSVNGSIELGGINGQHDCTTPGSGGAGNTPASRSAFYELNKIAEQARGWLPSNVWLQNQLTANVNIASTCNAFYDFVTVNFYRSGGGCRNTGELAAVFDHEWGHGLDDNDTGGQLSNSSEAYADIAAIYRLQASCVGHGFFWTIDDGCGQTADGTGFNVNEAQQGAAHCVTNCSGVRDSDWDKHANHTPDTPQNFVCGSCLSSTGPCGRQVHCAAAPSRQAAWDLVARDLRGAPFNYDSNTAFMIGNKLFYQGSGGIGLWHACDCTAGTSNGCGGTNGYMQWLAADDDNGNINDGTPHMTAIHAAFNRHNIACGTPTPVNSGCSGGPTIAPTVTPTAGDTQISLSWNSVAGASKYWVLRTEGHAGCDFGKVNLTPAGNATTSYVDTQVVNGRTYYYNIVGVGSSNSCFTPASACVSATPFSDCTLPPAPTNVSPANGATNVVATPNLDWTDVAGAISYDVDVATDAAFTNIVRSNNVANSNWTVSPALSFGTTYFWRARASNTCGPGPNSTPFSFTTVPPPPGTAVFDATLKAPKCATVHSFCDSNTILDGRDGVGPEPNQPNTINMSCADGTAGSYHADESNDKVKVSTLDATNLQVGKVVKIEATVWAYTAFADDHLDLYYAANANNPSWVFIGTLTPTAAGLQTLSANYTLPTGDLQAVRARFRYQGSATPCFFDSFNDHDDLIFAVAPAGGDIEPPTTSITSPTEGAIVSGTIPINANASDNVGVTNVEFYVDNNLIENDTDAPYSINWNTSTVTDGSHSLTTKAYDAANNVGTSVAVNVSVSNGGGCGVASQLLLNPGFESGNTGWTGTAGVITNNPAKPARTGTWKAWLGGDGISKTENLRQQLTIPANACTAQLDFWVRIDTSESGTLVKDRLRVLITNTAGQILSSLAILSNVDANNTYVQKTFDLSPFKGQTIRVLFRSQENASLQTSFVIDDTAVNITQ